MKRCFGYLSFLAGSVEPRSIRIPPYLSSYSSFNTSAFLHLYSPPLFRSPLVEVVHSYLSAAFRKSSDTIALTKSSSISSLGDLAFG